VTAACATLAGVTDVDASTPVPGQSPAPAFTAEDLVRLTGGRLLARSDRPIRGAAVDSRLVQPGELFVALPGERTDGHAFAGQAIAAGAAALIVTRPIGDADALGDVTVVRVADPLAALWAVATGWRHRFEPLVVGVTGSIAKTSTKEAVASVLAKDLQASKLIILTGVPGLLREKGDLSRLAEIQSEHSLLLRRADAFMDQLFHRNSRPASENDSSTELKMTSGQVSEPGQTQRLQPPLANTQTFEQESDQPSLVIGNLMIEVVPPVPAPAAPRPPLVVVRGSGRGRNGVPSSRRFGLGQF
jgi:hypothetical protein